MSSDLLVGGDLTAAGAGESVREGPGVLRCEQGSPQDLLQHCGGLSSVFYQCVKLVCPSSPQPYQTNAVWLAIFLLQFPQPA